MATIKLLDYHEASEKAQKVFDDIQQTRQTEYLNNFWKAMANQPTTMERLWGNLKTVMAPGALDGLTKELIYIAVSVANSCDYCIHSHTANAYAKGMTDEQYEELMAVIAMAHQTNALATGMKVEVDETFKK
jgi:AhpD family alkylhydroperoxidase